MYSILLNYYFSKRKKLNVESNLSTTTTFGKKGFWLLYENRAKNGKTSKEIVFIIYKTLIIYLQKISLIIS